MDGFELGASNLLVAYSPFGEKIVQWTILREAREKQVRPAAPTKREGSKYLLFLFCVIVWTELNNDRAPKNCRRNFWEEEKPS